MKTPTDFTDLHRTFCYRHLCKSVKSVGVFLSRKFCVFCEFCGSFSQQKVLWVL